VRAAPEKVKKRVTKTDRQQVLYSFFTYVNWLYGTLLAHFKVFHYIIHNRARKEIRSCRPSVSQEPLACDPHFQTNGPLDDDAK